MQQSYPVDCYTFIHQRDRYISHQSIHTKNLKHVDFDIILSLIKLKLLLSLTPCKNIIILTIRTNHIRLKSTLDKKKKKKEKRSVSVCLRLWAMKSGKDNTIWNSREIYPFISHRCNRADINYWGSLLFLIPINLSQRSM